MNISIASEKRHDGVERFRLNVFLRRSQWKRARRYREGFADRGAAEKRRKELLAINKARGMDGVCDAVWGGAPTGGAAGGMVEALARFLQVKKSAGRRGRTMENLKNRLEWLVKRLGDVPVAAVDSVKLQGLLDAMPRTKRTRINYGIAWRNFFRWCKRTGMRSDNPMEAVELPRAERGLPAVAAPWAVARILAAAWYSGGDQGRPGPLFGYALLSFFSPIRPDESLRVGWDRVNFERGFVVLDEGVTKVARIRHARLLPDLQRCLVAWKELKRPPAAWSRKGWERIRRRAGLDGARWVVDLGRHTYASSQYARTHDEAELSADMGNSVDVLRTHYLNKLVTSEEAAKWSGILATAAAKLEGLLLLEVDE